MPDFKCPTVPASFVTLDAVGKIACRIANAWEAYASTEDSWGDVLGRGDGNTVTMDALNVHPENRLGGLPAGFYDDGEGKYDHFIWRDDEGFCVEIIGDDDHKWSFVIHDPDDMAELFEDRGLVA